jgi:serine protease Do
MDVVKTWQARAAYALLAALLVWSVGAAAAQAQTAVAAPRSDSATSPAPAIPGPIPESYPWMRLAEALTPAVVNVRTSSEAPRSRAEETRPRQTRGLGSGFVVDPGGYIVTNHHVIDGARSIEVTLNDGRKLPAKLVGSDAETDIALIKVDATGLPTIPLGSSSALRVAEPVMAIGNPFGLDHTVTVGIISGTGRVIGAGRYDDFLQTDAAINPGNSGGPLINTRGEAVGIASAIASRSGGFQGVGFAIPIDLAKRALSNLESGKPASHPYLGIRVDALNASVSAQNSKLPSEGLLIAGVAKDSPAAAAGLKAGSESLSVGGQSYCVGGDVITAINGHAVSTLDDLQERISGYAAGDKLKLAVTGGDGNKRTVTLTVGSIPAQRQPLATGC